jgi:hypothetical protein
MDVVELVRAVTGRAGAAMAVFSIAWHKNVHERCISSYIGAIVTGLRGHCNL